ncbi:hypothetical protein BKA56DRAFT_568002 [Ilyonectria sp. MPI-CAGE-AT-0026]|nr:hypothetical protein BKA56DRAFT_568002 [Ilyonectria sp. MPI-CAGE-AT-0026]
MQPFQLPVRIVKRRWARLCTNQGSIRLVDGRRSRVLPWPARVPSAWPSESSVDICFTGWKRRDETGRAASGQAEGASQRMSPADGQMGNAFETQTATGLHRHSMPVDKLISSQLFTESRKPILQLPTSPSGTGIILTAAVPPRHSSHTLAHYIPDTRLDCVARLGDAGLMIDQVHHVRARMLAVPGSPMSVCPI